MINKNVSMWKQHDRVKSKSVHDRNRGFGIIMKRVRICSIYRGRFLRSMIIIDSYFRA